MRPILFPVRRPTPILFLKAIKNQAGYALYGTPLRWHKVSADKPAPADAHHVATSHYHVAAVKKLHADPAFHQLAPADQVHKVKGLAAELQSAATASAAVSQWKSSVLAGKTPTPAQQKAFDALPAEKKSALLEQVKAAGATPPAGAEPEKPASPNPWTDEQWSQLYLSPSNTNAPSHNKKIDALKNAADAGDVAAIQAMKFGSNTYGQKQKKVAEHLLAAMGGGTPAATVPPAPAAAAPKVTSATVKPKPAAPEMVHSFYNPEDGLAATVQKHADGKWGVTLKDTDAGEVLPMVNFYATEAEAVASAKKAAGLNAPPAPPKVASVRVKKPTKADYAEVESQVFHNTEPGHNKFWSVSTNGSTLKTVYGKIGAGGATTEKVFSSPEAAQAAAAKLIKEKTSKGYHAAGKSKHLYKVAAADTGPKEGDTKQGADGLLVLKNGRWVKVDKGNPADEGWDFTANDPGMGGESSLMFANPDGTIHYVAAGDEGYEVGSINPEGDPIDPTVVGSIDQIPAAAKQLGISVPPAHMLQKLIGSAGDKPAAQSSSGPANIDDWKQVGGQMGSNNGGLFEAPDGTKWYCKFPPDPKHAQSELLAAALYEAAGVAVPHTKPIMRDGKFGIASKWQDGLKTSTAAKLAKANGTHSGFAVDAWLANWDVIGLSNDNLQIGPDGKAFRVDVGGSLEYRAQGAKKPFGQEVTELASLRDPKVNKQAAAVFGKMTDADIAASVAKVLEVPESEIHALVMKYGPGSTAERQKLANTLIARQVDLAHKFPQAAKPKKQRLDPTKLPVDATKLPKPHDFANWNGAGQGLSSKAHVNHANSAVEQEMLTVAKKGNLPELKDFKYHQLDKETGQSTGKALPISNHPSKHVVQYHQDLVQILDEIANPPRPLKLFRTTEAATVEAIDAAFPPKPLGTTVGKVKSNEKLGFWVVLGGVTSIAKLKPKKTPAFTSEAIAAAHAKFQEAPKLARHFIKSVQASGSYNDLFRDGKTHDHSGNALADVAKAALEYSTTQPEGTSVYRWQHMSDQMVQKVLSAPDGTVIQATGPMCTSYSPTATKGFGKHRVTIRYAKGARAVDSFGSGGYAGEKEVTTLPNARFVVLSKAMVNDASKGGQRLELELLMLPPDIGVPGVK